MSAAPRVRPVAAHEAPAVLALLHAAHAWSLANGFNFRATRLRLDTPETHPWLPAFYGRLGYRPTGTVQWEGKRYRSVWLEKRLGLDQAP